MMPDMQTLDIQRSQDDRQAALLGYQAELARVNTRIAEVKALMGTNRQAGTKSGWTATKRTISAAGRKRISLAQKARWAKVKARKRLAV